MKRKLFIIKFQEGLSEEFKDQLIELWDRLPSREWNKRCDIHGKKIPQLRKTKHPDTI